MYQDRLSLPLGSSRKSTQRARQRVLALGWDGGLKFCINKGGGGMSHLICDQGQTAKHTHDYKKSCCITQIKENLHSRLLPEEQSSCQNNGIEIGCWL